MKKIIYGNSNFRKVKINNDYLYIEKTDYIEKLVSKNGITEDNEVKKFNHFVVKWGF